MLRSFRFVLLSASAFSIIAAPPAAYAAPAPTWVQSRTDVVPDPAVRFGVLANGVRYAIRKNATPPGQAALRLVIDAGSLNEADDEQGLAHLLEHMAFNGSKTAPEGDMVKILERHGLAFGPDTNASTGFSQTTYQLDLPKTDDATVDVALGLLRDVGGDLTLPAQALERERGVVLSEERLRDTPAFRVSKQTLGFVLQGQRPPQRFPIGKTEVIKSVSRDKMQAFYHRQYRPERSVVVAVGDFDVAAMEAKIKARFSDWAAQGEDAPRPASGPVLKRGVQTKAIIEAGAPTSLQLSWTSPVDPAVDSMAKRRRDFVRQLGFVVLNRRLATLARGDDPPFISAGAFHDDLLHAAQATTIAATARPDRWQGALGAIDLEQRRIVRFGVGQDELDREVEGLRAGLKARAAGETTQRSTALAQEIVASLDDDEVVTSPSQDLAFFEEVVKGLKADQVSTALADAFKGAGPLIVLTTGQAVTGGDKAVADAYALAQKTAPTANTAQAVIDWPYTTFGAPGQVVEEREIADLDAVFVRFSNGVRLTIKPTKFRTDQVLVKVRAAGGTVALPPEQQSPSWAASAFIEGGLKDIATQDMERALNAKRYGARFGVEDDAVALAGATRPEDLATQMQVLAAYATQPGWRDAAFARAKAATTTLHDQLEATPGGVLSRDLPGLLRSGDQRFVLPSRQALAAAQAGPLKAAAQALQTAPLEVIVVGDTTVEKAVKAAAETFGALPARQGDAVVGGALKFPAGGGAPVVLTHKGRADQAMAFIAWPTDDFFSNPQRARDTAVLGDILQSRLQDELRAKQGATYSPSVGSTATFVWPHFGYLAASVEAAPDKLDGVLATIQSIAADLRATPPTQDELDRAKRPRLERLEQARNSNEYWLNELSGAQADPRRLDALRSVRAGVEHVTAADVRAAASLYLTDAAAWRLKITPQTKAD